MVQKFSELTVRLAIKLTSLLRDLAVQHLANLVIAVSLQCKYQLAGLVAQLANFLPSSLTFY